MTLVDANILLYAVDASSDRHKGAVAWWDERLSGSDPVCLCWTVIGAFLRISTNKRVFEAPLSLEEARDKVSGWLDDGFMRCVSPRA